MEEKRYLEGKDIVIVGITPIDWDLPNNCKDMAYELAKKNRVLYVNIPLKRSEAFKKKDAIKSRLEILAGKRPGLEKVSENLWTYFPDIVTEPINRLKIRWLFDQLNYINNKRYARSISKAIQSLNFKDFVILNDNDVYTGFYLKEFLKPALYIYYTRDMLASMPYWQAHLPRLEPVLFKKSDMVVANSTHLSQYAGQYSDSSFYIGQGCDVSHFIKDAGSLEVPEDIGSLPFPRIGYIGALTSQRLDISLIGNLARKRPDWSFILIGPSDNAFRQSDLHQLSNVHFFGPREFVLLPNYLKGIDVCINPQSINELTIGNYPRKVDEYLAAGKPVVATKTDAMIPFADYTYLATDVESYERNIRKALEETGAEHVARRKQFAASHTWENCILEMDRSIVKWLSSNGRRTQQ